VSRRKYIIIQTGSSATTRFDDPSFSSSRDIIAARKKFEVGHVTWLWPRHF